MQWAKKQTGFTIVELLIVVVVIAILAAITVVAYTGITQRAKESTSQNAAAQAARKMATYSVDNADLYPADEPTFLAYANLQDNSPGATSASGYQYTVSSDRKTYCITTTTNSISYFTTSTNQTPVKGACPGHGADGVTPIMNYAVNPNATGSISGFGQAGAGPAASTWTISTVQAHNGSTSLRKDITGSGQTGASAQTDSANRPRVNAGQQFSWSLWVYSTKAGNIVTYCDGSRVSDGVGAGLNGSSTAVAANTWRKLTATVTASVDMYVTQCGGYGLPVVSGDTVWFDEFMLTNGSGANYADGSTAGWAWMGTANASYSVGPPQ